MVATPLYYLRLFSPSRCDLGCDRWRLHWGRFGESILLVKCAKGMLFLYIRFPLVFVFNWCIFIYLYCVDVIFICFDVLIWLYCWNYL